MELADWLIVAGVFLGILDAAQLFVDIPMDAIGLAAISGGVILKEVK